MPVNIEIGGDNATGIESGRNRHARQEAAGAVSEQQRHAGTRIGDGEIEVAVAVEVLDDDFSRIGAGCERRRGSGREAAGAVAEEQRHVIVQLIGSLIELASLLKSPDTMPNGLT